MQDCLGLAANARQARPREALDLGAERRASSVELRWRARTRRPRAPRARWPRSCSASRSRSGSSITRSRSVDGEHLLQGALRPPCRPAGPGPRRRCSGRSGRRRSWIRCSQDAWRPLRRRRSPGRTPRPGGAPAPPSAAAWASAATARGSSSLPSSLAACLARLAAASILIAGSYFGLQRLDQRLDRVDLAAVGERGVERLEGTQRLDQVDRELRVRRPWLQLGGEQVGQLAEQLWGRWPAWRRSGSGWPARTPTASRPTPGAAAGRTRPGRARRRPACRRAARRRSPPRPRPPGSRTTGPRNSAEGASTGGRSGQRRRLVQTSARLWIGGLGMIVHGRSTLER